MKAVSQFDNLQKAFSTQRVKEENKDLVTSFEPELDELFALDEDRVSHRVIKYLYVLCKRVLHKNLFARHKLMACAGRGLGL